MHIAPEIIDDMNLLRRFSLGGLGNMDFEDNPDPAIADAAVRLQEKGLMDENNRLTDAGREAVEHLTRLCNLLDPPLEPI